MHFLKCRTKTREKTVAIAKLATPLQQQRVIRTRSKMKGRSSLSGIQSFREKIILQKSVKNSDNYTSSFSFKWFTYSDGDNCICSLNAFEKDRWEAKPYC